jgi:starch phosphorylase
LVAHDFDSFVQAQKAVEHAYQDQQHWTQMSILNTAASGTFSSDRTISQYSDDIWHLEALTTSSSADTAVSNSKD